MFHMLTGEVTTVGWSSISDVITAVTNQISIPTILSVLTGAIGISITFVFLWWGVRKGIRVILNGAMKGKQKQ